MTDLASAPRVLIVDDTSDFRLLLRVALELEGLDVVDDVGDGMQGISAAREQQPDIVLLDLAMPVMDGLEALPLITAASPSSKIIVLSGFQAQSMEASALAAGAHAYQQKGATADTIIASIWAVLGRSHDRPTTAAAVARAPLPQRQIVWGWLEAAPLATVVLDRAETRVLHHNSAAARLLGWTSSPPSSAASDVLSDTRAQVASPDEAHTVAYLPTPGEGAAEISRIRSAIAATAHEIRNPVSTLLGVAQMLSSKADLLTPAVQTQLLTSLGRQAHVLDRVTADLLTAAQADRGTLRIQATNVPVLPALQAAAATVDADVDITCPDDLAVQADPVRVDQMLLNLMSNAHKYARPPYRWSAHLEGTRVSISLEDTGDGVPKDFQAHLFQEFSRAPGTRVAGSGIGLYIVRALAEQQGGGVGYEARQTGGSRFTLVLPVGSAE